MNATLFRILERLASRQLLMAQVLTLPRTASPARVPAAVACHAAS